jgi:hypothetical protein
VVTFVWNLTPVLDALLYELIPAFTLAFFATVAVSWATRPPHDTTARMRAMKGVSSLSTTRVGGVSPGPAIRRWPSGQERA